MTKVRDKEGRCKEHKLAYFLDTQTETGKVLLKCVDCPYFLWLEPKKAAILVGKILRCARCQAPFKVSEYMATRAEFVCHDCMWKDLEKDPAEFLKAAMFGIEKSKVM